MTNKTAEEILIELVKAVEMTSDDLDIHPPDIADTPDGFRSWMMGRMGDYAAAIRREMWAEVRPENVKKYKKHICYLNDGRQNCDCFLAGYNAALYDIDQRVREVTKEG